VKIIPFITSEYQAIITSLGNNQVVIMPTDTIYGLHLPYSMKNLVFLNNLKKRPAMQPINLLYTNTSQLQDLFDLKEAELTILQRLSAIKPLTTIITTNEPCGQAVRLISADEYPLLAKIIDNTGPLLSTSANLHKNSYLAEKGVICETFEGEGVNTLAWNDLIISRETPSTIVDIRNNRYEIIRPGDVSREMILELVSK